jgi:hypothetical protein
VLLGHPGRKQVRETEDGIGLPGTHSCGASVISALTPYLG